MCLVGSCTTTSAVPDQCGAVVWPLGTLLTQAQCVVVYNWPERADILKPKEPRSVVYGIEADAWSVHGPVYICRERERERERSMVRGCILESCSLVV